MIQHVPVITKSGMPIVYQFQKGASHSFLLNRICCLNQRTFFLSSEYLEPSPKSYNPLLWGDQILSLFIIFLYVVIRPSFTLVVVLLDFIVELFLVSYSVPSEIHFSTPWTRGLLRSCILFWQHYWSLEPQVPYFETIVKTI